MQGRADYLSHRPEVWDGIDKNRSLLCTFKYQKEAMLADRNQMKEEKRGHIGKKD